MIAELAQQLLDENRELRAELRLTQIELGRLKAGRQLLMDGYTPTRDRA